jgi:hypothetical protein
MGLDLTALVGVGVEVQANHRPFAMGEVTELPGGIPGDDPEAGGIPPHDLVELEQCLGYHDMLVPCDGGMGGRDP